MPRFFQRNKKPIEEVPVQPGPSETVRRPKCIAPKPPAMLSPTGVGAGAMPLNGGWLQNQVGYTGMPNGMAVEQRYPGSHDGNDTLVHMMGLQMGLTGQEASGKRPRTFISKEQAEVMLEEFEKNAIPNKEMRARLASRLNLSSRVIQVWFQNRRAKMKRRPNGDYDGEGGQDSLSSKSDSPMSHRKRPVKPWKSEENGKLRLPDKHMKSVKPYFDLPTDNARLRSLSMSAMQRESNEVDHRFGRQISSDMTMMAMGHTHPQAGSGMSLSSADLSLVSTRHDPSLGDPSMTSFSQDMNAPLINNGRSHSEPLLDVSTYSQAQIQEALAPVVETEWDDSIGRPNDLKLEGSLSNAAMIPNIDTDHLDTHTPQNNLYTSIDLFLDDQPRNPRRVRTGALRERPRSRSFDNLTDLKFLLDRDRPLPRSTLDMDDTQIDAMLRGGNIPAADLDAIQPTGLVMEQLREDRLETCVPEGNGHDETDQSIRSLIEETHRISMDIDKEPGMEELNLNMYNTPTANFLRL